MTKPSMPTPSNTVLDELGMILNWTPEVETATASVPSFSGDDVKNQLACFQVARKLVCCLPNFNGKQYFWILDELTNHLDIDS